MADTGFPKSDWKLYKEKLPVWQEDYMERLCQEYLDLLNSDQAASKKFWDLKERIYDDKSKVGVRAVMTPSMMHPNIVELIRENVITTEDLDGFSDELKEAVQGSLQW